MTMKNFIFFSLLCCSFLSLTAQTGPAGIGNSSNIRTWLDASSLGLANNDSVSSWTDLSGNSNHAALVSGFLKPTYKTNQINSKPALNFTGAEALELTSNITDSAVTIFAIYKKLIGSVSGAPFSTSNHMFLHNNSVAVFIYNNPIQSNTRITKADGSFSVFTVASAQEFTGASLVLTNGTSTSSFTRNQGFGLNSSTIGVRNTGNPSYINPFEGDFAEFIAFNERLNNAKRNIIASYLAAKYNLTGIKPLYAFKTTYNNDVLGIGQESDGSHTTADNNGRITFSNASGLGNGEYLLIGHDNAGFAASTSTPGNISQRWTQVFRADETGNVGTVDIVIDFSSAILPSSNPNNYALLIETADGDFSNGGTSTINATSVNIGAFTATFNGVDLPDGAYFTLAEKVGDIASAQPGQWDQTTTWDCGCIPTQENNVEINHAVTIDADAEADNVTLSSGSLTFSGSDTLTIYGDFGIASTFTKGSGTIEAASTTFQQTFTNSTGGIVQLHNLYVNCTDPLLLNTGNWEVDNNLQVTTGGLNVTATTSVTLTSDASTISQILPSMSNAFTGNITVQRHIGARSANYANLSSPMTSSTFADIDDDLFLSGLTGGGDGNATVNGGGTFYSVYSYNSAATKHDTVSNVTDDMRQGEGYEVYLATTLGSFSATTIDFVGTPATGPLGVKSPTINPGWNLIGNPYHSYINYDNLDLQADLAGTFYIYNSSTGSYSALTQGSNTLIAPSQGFWVDKTSGVARTFDFAETNKSESHSASFLRKDKPFPEALKLNVRESGSPYSQDMLIRFSPMARNTFDEFDARYLASPHAEIPAITSKATNSDEDLIINSLDNLSGTQLIPLNLKSGKASTYEINAQNLDAIYQTYDCIYLKDKELNKTIDLSVETKYNFESEEGDFNRFELIVSKDYESCQKVMSNESSIVQKIENAFDLRNNMNGWWLDYSFDTDYMNQIEVRVYNLSGQEVISPSAYQVEGAGSIQLNQLQELNGIYLIQIVSKGEILNKTIKL